jgi:nitronate monooxygenase
MLAVNVMRAVSSYADYVRQACTSGIDAIVVGAGLPLDLPDLTAAFPDVALIPILSDARGIQLIVKKWLRKDRLPDAIIIEHPCYAGGHLGAATVADLTDPRFDFEQVIPATFAFFRMLGIADDAIPLIPAGGINSPQRVPSSSRWGRVVCSLAPPSQSPTNVTQHRNSRLSSPMRGPRILSSS